MEHVEKLFQDSAGESDWEEDKTPTKIRSNGTIMCLNLPVVKKRSQYESDVDTAARKRSSARGTGRAQPIDLVTKASANSNFEDTRPVVTPLKGNVPTWQTV